MLITKVLLAAKTDCNWFASTQLPYLLAGVTTLPSSWSPWWWWWWWYCAEQTLWLTVMLEQLSVLSHSEALIEHFMTQHRYFALIAVEVNKSRWKTLFKCKIEVRLNCGCWGLQGQVQSVLCIVECGRDKIASLSYIFLLPGWGNYRIYLLLGWGNYIIINGAYK